MNWRCLIWISVGFGATRFGGKSEDDAFEDFGVTLAAAGKSEDDAFEDVGVTLAAFAAFEGARFLEA